MDWQVRIEQTCSTGLAAKPLRERLLGLVREKVPHDAHVFAITDPVTMVTTSPHAVVPMLPWGRLPEMIRLRYRSTANRVDRLVGRPAVSLSALGHAPGEMPVYEEVQRGIGIKDVVSVVFADRFGVWGYLELWRTAEDFNPSEVAVLTRLQIPVTAALRRAVAATFVEEDELGPIGPAVVVLAPDLVLRGRTEAAAAAMLRLLPPDEEMPPVPAAAYNIGAALLAAEAGLPLGDAWARVHLGGSRWITARASRLGEGGDIAVALSPAEPAERLDLFARAHGLSAREREILERLTVGSDSRTMAMDLSLSEHTVNDHVKAILAKTGVRTRALLLARALGSGSA